jgi:hypothetical protein
MKELSVLRIAIDLYGLIYDSNARIWKRGFWKVFVLGIEKWMKGFGFILE